MIRQWIVNENVKEHNASNSDCIASNDKIVNSESECERKLS